MLQPCQAFEKCEDFLIAKVAEPSANDDQSEKLLGEYVWNLSLWASEFYQQFWYRFLGVWTKLCILIFIYICKRLEENM